MAKYNASLISFGLAGMGLASYGLAGFDRSVTSKITKVWILSSAVTPQPANKRGQWDDAGVWVDVNVWYD